MEYNFHNCVPQWQISIQIAISIFVLALFISEKLTFKMLDLEKIGQGHSQFLQWHPSMANINFYKIVQCIYALALTVLKIFTFKKVGQGHCFCSGVV